MNCVLTTKQLKLLLGKVAIDLDGIDKLDFNSYAKDFYNLILDKTGDKVLAANYVGLLPTNIWAVMGVSKAIRKKFAAVAGQLAELETRFEDFGNVENFVNDFVTTGADMAKLEKRIQEDSLTKSPQQEQSEPAIIGEVTHAPIQKENTAQVIKAFDDAAAKTGINKNTALKEFKQNFPTLAEKAKTITNNFSEIVKHLKETQNLIEKC